MMPRLIALAALLLSACEAVPPPAPIAPPGDAVECRIAGSSNWQAWINAMPGPGARPTLIITGDVTVPTGGYRVELADVQALESYPVQIVAQLRSIPPAGGATQAIVTHHVRREWPIAPPVGSVTVRCGGAVVARIAPVETAQ
jgi:hypothetical protein